MNALRDLPPATKEKLHNMILKHPVMVDLKGHDDIEVMLLDILIWLNSADPAFPPGPK